MFLDMPRKLRLAPMLLSMFLPGTVLVQEETLPPDQAAGWAVAYLAPAPLAAWGLAGGQLGRDVAHHRAQALCLARSGGVACRLALEVRSQCLAVAQAPLPGDSEQRVVYAAVGSGRRRAAAEAEAVEICHARVLSRSFCRVAESICAGG